MRQPVWVLSLVLAILAAGIIIVVVNSTTEATSNTSSSPSRATDSTEPWPAFVMVYREETYQGDSGQIDTYDVYRYNYQGRRNWRLELIESIRDPRAVGSWSSYDGKTYKNGEANASADYTNQSDHDVMATWWLVPVRPGELGKDGKYQRVESGDTSKIKLHQDDELLALRFLSFGKRNYVSLGSKTIE